MSVTDVLMDAHTTKADRLGDAWVVNNCPKKETRGSGGSGWQWRQGLTGVLDFLPNNPDSCD